jgi:hypothetical protein
MVTAMLTNEITFDPAYLHFINITMQKVQQIRTGACKMVKIVTKMLWND